MILIISASTNIILVLISYYYCFNQWYRNYGCYHFYNIKNENIGINNDILTFIIIHDVYYICNNANGQVVTSSILVSMTMTIICPSITAYMRLGGGRSTGQEAFGHCKSRLGDLRV